MNNNEPHWKGRGIAAAAIARKDAAAVAETKRQTPIAQALAALNDPALKALGTSVNMNLLAAVIIAQALDRAAERVVEAAAVSTYKRST